MKPKKLDIELGLLTVDLGNFRIGDYESTREAYAAMIEEEGEDLSNLAEDILTLGLSPAELFIVCPDLEKLGHYIVCEGNRRITALRLLETPSLADGTLVHKKFIAMSKRYAAQPIKKVSCVILKDKESAFIWIRRKHQDLGGRGVAQWGAEATARADAFDGKIRPSKAVIDHLRTNKLLSQPLELALGRQTTNLDRVFQMPYLKSVLGVTIGKEGTISFGNGDNMQGNELLGRMAKAMTAKNFNVNNIRSKTQRMDFIDKFSKYAVLPSEGGAGVVGKVTRAGAKAAAKRATKKRPSSLDRKCLALKGKDYMFSISDPRLNELYEEALKIEPIQLPNSSAVLTRVFLELSTDFYLSKKKIPLPAHHASQGKKHWGERGITLTEKLKATLLSIDPSQKDPRLKEPRKGVSSNELLHSVPALHDYLHSLTADPDPKEIKRIWTRWHPYLAMLFENLT